MVGKRGFIRTMEAVIAILLILGFLLYILPKTPTLAESSIPESLNSAREYILTQFLTDNYLRECVKGAILVDSISDTNKCRSIDYGEKTTECRTKISSLLDDNTPSGFANDCEICKGTNPCTQVLNEGNARKSIYPGAIFMYYLGGDTKYLRIYFWRE
jgi:hypothetical protein